MKKLLPLSALLAAGLLCVSNLDGAFPENTGAPNELTCGRAPCHNVPVNVGTALMSIQFNGNGLKYMADSTYELTVKVENQPTVRNGFEILALNASNQNTGTWKILDANKTKVISGIGLPNRKYVTHKAAGNLQTEWKVAWKAPATNVGNVTFYASVNASNNNGQLSGDEIYTKSQAVAFSAVSETQEADPDSAFGLRTVAPAASGKSLELYYNLNEAADIRVELFNILGQGMNTLFTGKQAEGEHRLSWDNGGEEIVPGIYMVRLSAGRKVSTLKFIWP